MNRDKAAQKVNEAFAAAKVNEAIHDAKVKGVTVEIDGKTASLIFKHGANALEQRRHEVAVFRAHLVAEITTSSTLLKEKPEEPEKDPAEPPKEKA